MSNTEISYVSPSRTNGTALTSMAWQRSAMVRWGRLRVVRVVRVARVSLAMLVSLYSKLAPNVGRQGRACCECPSVGARFFAIPCSNCHAELLAHAQLTFQGQKAPPLQGRGCMPPRPQASI